MEKKMKRINIMSDYYENEFYYEPTEFDLQIDEFKKSLMKNVKQEFFDKMEKIQQENIKLQEIKKNWESLKDSYAEKERELAREKENAISEARKLQLSKLFKDREIVMYKVGYEYVKRPKCNKCNDSRKIEYVSPLGHKMAEDCDCSKSDSVNVPVPWVLYEFRTENTYNKELLMWYQELKGNSGDTYFNSYSEICKKVYDNSMKYEDIDRYTFFRNQEDCQKYCDWLNKNSQMK
jgi:DNA gyrase/topoisomerase IV subunit A